MQQNQLLIAAKAVFSFVLLICSLPLLLIISLVKVSGEFFRSEGAEADYNDKDGGIYYTEPQHVPAQEDTITGGQRTSIIITRVVEADGRNYITIDSPQVVDGLFASTLLAYVANFVGQQGMNFIFGGGIFDEELTLGTDVKFWEEAATDDD